MITLGSLFDGVGVFPLAAKKYGITPVWASEIEKAPISITRRHFPEMEHLGDITKLHGGMIPPVDVITFGSPCQNLSSIGNREGLAGEKSGLFYEAIRIIREMREATNGRYPTFALWENVAGAAFSNGGHDFRAVLSAFLDVEIPMPSDGKWAPAGMVCGGGADLAWRLLDSQYFGVAQRRRRIFLLADYGGSRTSKILFDPEPLLKILYLRGKGKYALSAPDGEGFHKTGRNPPEVYFLEGRKLRGAARNADAKSFHGAVVGPDRPCPTLLAGDAQNIVLLYPGEPERDVARQLTPLEYERLMGLPDGWTKFGHDDKKISDSARYKALGNAIVLPCAEYIMAGIANTLKEDSIDR